MKTIKFGILTVLCVVFLTVLSACQEQGRFEIGFDDTTPPSAPVYLRYKPLYGGARLFYQIPRDEDLISIDASYTVKDKDNNEREVWFSISYFTDSLDVYGFDDTSVHVVSLYAVDRAGNRSVKTVVPVIPLEPAFRRVEKSLKVTPGFGSFFIDWVNELEQNINVYVNFTYSENGTQKKQELIYTSRLPSERWFIRGLDNLTEQDEVSIKVKVEDQYGNITDFIDKDRIVLLQDEVIPKEKWRVFAANDTIGGVPMAFLSGAGQRVGMVIDNIIDDGVNQDYGNTSGAGRTGLSRDGNSPWNLMIDLGEEYEISRILTHQRYVPNASRIWGTYYNGLNVAVYALYIGQVTGPDLNTGVRWDYVGRYDLFAPNVTDIEKRQAGMAGDMMYLYPDDPKFTVPTQWFRYEAIYGWSNDVWVPNSTANCQQLSELTLYARRKK